MNNKLIVERKKLRDERKNNSEYMHKLYLLKEFLAAHENSFNKKESIEALKRIKNYLSEKQVLIDKYNSVKHQINEIKGQLYECCLHEIHIEVSEDMFYCPICESLKLKSANNGNHIMLESQFLNRGKCVNSICYYDDNRTKKTEVNIIQDIIYKIANSNENIFDSFENYIKNEQLDVKLKYKNNM